MRSIFREVTELMAEAKRSCSEEAGRSAQVSVALARAEAELQDLRAELSRNAQMASRLNEAEAEVRAARGEVTS